ncbi:xylose isomerase-like protein [Roridomyces roridus]|uniref:Apurinic-apyrimidinic endonuclease 1 n=1 Tax=Roridomyces roridus TaxID=1738132 RepID=A0AAD7FAC3_9AGAR|nr:xylose isomerase-like protein [Roridomyces roridus]
MLRALPLRPFNRCFPSKPLSTLMPKRKSSSEAVETPAKKSRLVKTKEQPEPLAQRSESLWKVGAHVSAAGGIQNAIANAAAVGANSFALFVKSQRKWTSPALTQETISAFKAGLKEHGYDPRHILPHGSYLINLGNPDATKRKKSYDCFLDDLKRCEALGLALYNFHPGSTVGQATTEESISLIAQSINDAHKATESVVTVLENMAGAGNIIGGDFQHLAQIIQQVDDKTRVGVCLDTCHMFAAGYDLRVKEEWDRIVTTFDEQVGLQYLRAMHLNDSKTPHNSKKDRHENIGMGHIGLTAFHHILNDVRMQGIPLILETPSFEQPEVWATEIAVLDGLSGFDLQSEEGLDGLVERVKAVVKRAEGGGKKGKKGKKAPAKKGKKKEEQEDEEDEDE